MGKPIVMAFVTLISIYALTKSWYIAGCIALIPLLFGLLNIFVKFGYAVAGFSLIAAVVWTVITPTMKLHLVRVAESVWEGVVHSTEADRRRP